MLEHSVDSGTKKIIYFGNDVNGYNNDKKELGSLVREIYMQDAVIGKTDFAEMLKNDKEFNSIISEFISDFDQKGSDSIKNEVISDSLNTGDLFYAI